jgi:hypothetical protein
MSPKCGVTVQKGDAMPITSKGCTHTEQWCSIHPGQLHDAAAAADACRYYDAGDFVKFNLPQAFAMAMLSWGVMEFKEVRSVSCSR